MPHRRRLARRAAAPQLDKSQRWFALVRYIADRILAATHRPAAAK